MLHMMTFLKKIVALFPPAFRREIYWYKNKFTRDSIIRKWQALENKPNPPHQFKQATIEKVGKENNLDYLVETGTFRGHMIEAQRKNFKELYSIEVEPTLFKDAEIYFKPYPHIHIIKGDSAYELKKIVAELKDKPVLFWLDGHYSGEVTGMGESMCPIYKELESVFEGAKGRQYILIDDARLFNGTEDYPTMPELVEFVNKRSPGKKISVNDDIIHIH